MPKYTIVGDPHCKPDNIDKIEKLFDLIEDLGNPAVILGDLLDTKDLVRARCLNVYLRRFAESSLDFLVLRGNHDMVSLDSSEHALEALELFPNVIVVDKPTTVNDFYCLPYIHDVGELRTALAAHDGRTVLAHADIQGLDFGNGRISDIGLEVSDLAGCKRIISGHYHKYQNLGNITYLGTPFSHSFGEANQEKFLGIYDTDTDELELLSMTGVFSQHISYEIDVWRTAPKFLLDLDPNNHYRAILIGTQEHINLWPRDENIKYIERPTASVAKSVIYETDTPETQFVKWAETIKGYSQEIQTLGLEILKNV